MSFFAQNHDTSVAGPHLFVCRRNGTLQTRHNRTRCIDDFYMVAFGFGIGCGRFSVSAYQQSVTGYVRKIRMSDGMQSQLFQSVYLQSVVDDVAQRVDFARRQ